VRSIGAAAKALDVSYDFERIYTAGRFLTSVRPIFDDARERILGTTVVQTLRLEYSLSNGDPGSLSFALDKADIRQLMQSCAEALRKADITLHDLKNVWGIPTIMPGEDSE
jgi:hypothetical protein